MNRIVQRGDWFEADFARQFAWYAREAGEAVAWRFQAALHSTLLSIAQRPETGRIRHFSNARLHGVRSAQLERPFDKLLIFYRVTDQSLQMIRLVHGARDLPRRLLEAPESAGNQTPT